MGMAERWARTRPLPDDIHKRLAALRPFLQRENVLLAYLFGSLAAGETGHDVDLALLMPKGRPAFPLREPLQGLLGTQRLDLVDLGKASPSLRFEVIRSGRLLYKVDDETENEILQAELGHVQVWIDCTDPCLCLRRPASPKRQTRPPF